MEEIKVKANILAQMLPIQKKLLDRYVAKGSLPPYPLQDLESKTNQRTLKGFVDCFIEELSEAYSELELMLQAISSNDSLKAKEHLRAYNEEVADANHFLLEFLIYCQYEEAELDSLLESFCRDMNFEGLFENGKPFDVLMKIAGVSNRIEQRGIYVGKGFRVAEEIESLNDFTLRGGRRINDSMLVQHAELLWCVTHSFKKVNNTLKNRDWTSSHRALNTNLFEEKLLHALLWWANYLEFAGFSQTSICLSYLRKADINLERINNGY